jgi:regulator of protease activity HflC (stomatin/prohibitin superfamily)
MKKTSIELILLLSNIYNRKQLGELFKDIRSLETDQLETVLARLEEYKAQSFGVGAEAISAALERNRIELERQREQKQAELERQKEEKRVEAERKLQQKQAEVERQREAKRNEAGGKRLSSQRNVK